MTNMLSQAALLLNKTYQLLSTGSSKAKSDPNVPPESCLLLSLPNELMTMICKDEVLINKDLASLRLTCKHTKYFASDILDQHLFVDVSYPQYAPRWFFHFSHLGSHVQSLSLFRPSIWSNFDKTHRLRPYPLPDDNTKPEYSHLRNLRVIWADYPDRLKSTWKKVLRAAAHLKVFNYEQSPRFDTGEKVHDIGRIYRQGSDPDDELLGSIRSDCLTEVVLIGLHPSASALKQLLRHHSGTLSTLEIKCCWLFDRQWLEIMDWIRSNLPNLQILRVDVSHEAVARHEQYKIKKDFVHLKRGDVPYIILTLKKPIRLKLEGRKAIDDGLIELLDARKWKRVEPRQRLIGFLG
jgi:hypothetical protein